MAVRAEEVPTLVPADDFQALESKVYRTIELYKSAREARTAAERDVQRIREQLEEREEQVETLRREMVQERGPDFDSERGWEEMLRDIDIRSAMNLHLADERTGYGYCCKTTTS